jgi:hypothetical protein
VLVDELDALDELDELDELPVPHAGTPLQSAHAHPSSKLQDPSSTQ